jgi:hypothetical protein
MLEPLDYWRFHEEYTVVEAALLSLNISPSNNLHVLGDSIKPLNFNAVFSGFTKAIANNKLKANINYCKDYDGSDSDDPNWEQTHIDVNDLKLWMARINFKPEFFFPKETADPDYLNKDHSRYSEKLAAAVTVWLAMDDDKLTSGKGVVDAMKSWLTNNYKDFDLTHKQSNPKSGYKVGDINTGAINYIAKIANWNEKGGTPTTPTSTTTETKVSSMPANNSAENIDNFKKTTEPYTPESEPIYPSEHIDFDDNMPF